MFMVVLLLGLPFGQPDLASLLSKTGGMAKTHRCLAVFFGTGRILNCGREVI
jgi:hypothetical protein